MNNPIAATDRGQQTGTGDRRSASSNENALQAFDRGIYQTILYRVSRLILVGAS